MIKTKYIYKILTPCEWKEVEKNQMLNLTLQPNDMEFIHLSKKTQIAATISRYYYNNKELVLLKFKTQDLKKNLRWEKSTHNQYFPHYYGCIPAQFILDVLKIRDE